MLKVYTAQYRYSGRDRLDITAQGQAAFGRFFAPGWSMVKGLKNGSMTEEEYEQRYREMMLDGWHKHREIWETLLNMEQVTLVCFCAPGAFCHRMLLVSYLEKLGAVYLGERDLTNGQMELITNMSILDVNHGIICQQVNCRGVMGAGLARKMRNKWPQVYSVYRQHYEEGKLRVGNMHLVPINMGAYGKFMLVANLCGQDGYGRDKRYTDYIGLRKALLKLREWRIVHHEFTGDALPIYFPHGMSSTLAGGDWYLVRKIIEDVFPDAIIVKYN